MADPSVPHSDKEVGVEKEIQPERNSPQGEREITSSDSKPEENRAAQDESSSGSPSVTEEQPPKTPPPIEEKSRAKTRITLIMLALGVCLPSSRYFHPN